MLVLSVCLAWLSVYLSGVSAAHDVAPQEFTINMDLSAEEKWGDICPQYKQYVIGLIDAVLEHIPDAIVAEGMKIFDHWYEKNAYEPYRSEIAYFANCTGLELGDLVILNLIYDLLAWCTSIVAETSDGTILHGRNLDFSFAQWLRDDTIVIHATDSDGNILFHGTTFFGYVGMWTGVKPMSFSLSGDERDQGSLIENIRRIVDDWRPTGWLMRDVLTNATDYNDAIDQLSNTLIQAPVYYIVGGLRYSDGAVITRNQTVPIDVWLLENSEYDWYLVETNYDHWLPPPPDDDRRDAAIKDMNAVGQDGLTVDSLYEVLSTPPLLRNHTCYTTIMSASDPNYYYARIRYYP